MSRECGVSFADLFRRVHRREWTADEEFALRAMDQEARNRWVRDLARQADDVRTEDRPGTDGRAYTAFWFEGAWIRPVTEDDAPAVVRLLNDVVAAGLTAMSRTFTVEDQLSFQRELPARAVYFAALDGETGELLGIQDVLPEPTDPDGERGEISTFVAASARGKGVGRRLCEQTFAAAVQLGFRRLCAVIPAHNEDAVAFYRAMGFGEGTPDDVPDRIRLERSLEASAA